MPYTGRFELRRWLIVAGLAVLICAAHALSLWSPSGIVRAQDNAADQVASASEAEAPPEPPRTYLGWMWEALGLFWLLVFSLISFVMVALIMMNILQIRRDNLLPEEFIESFEQKLNAKDFQGAYESARNDESFVGRVLAAGMSRLNRGYQEAVEGMQEVGEDENMALEHRLSYLALIGSVAPMLGLMGTVQGMIASFSKIAQATVSPKPSWPPATLIV